jgi:CRISPR-associated protein Csx10
MYQIHYKIRTLSPILLTWVTGDTNMVSTLDYIPGSVVLGIFAKEYIDKNDLGRNAHEDQYFHRCFLNSSICFTNACLSESNGKDRSTFYPTPLSIQSSKEDENEIFDLMITSKKQTEYLGNYCEIIGDKIHLASASRSINFHHSRKNRIKGHSDDGTIFNYESLDALQEFSGWIIGEEADLNIILELIGSKMKINIGRSKQIQYGKAELELLYDIPDTPISEVHTFNHDRLNNPFILTFWSPAIIYNKNGFPSTSITDLEKYLSSHLVVQPEDIHILEAFMKSEVVENFVSKWLLKKPSETCFKAGSCFKIQIEGLNNNIKRLFAELEKTGIGERTGEGFGRFLVNMQQNDHYIRDYGTNLNTDKPEGSVPDITQKIIKNVAIRSYLTIAEVQALKDGSGFNKNKDKIPTNSLLGRLIFMIKESDNAADFISKVSELPETATNNIKRCRNDQIDLYEFINSSDPHVSGILNQDQDLKNCCSFIGFEPSSNEELKNKIFRHYWLTFLAIMRKERKRED